MGEAKVRVQIYISREVRDKLYELVKKKYPSLKGLSEEVEKALRYWFDLQGVA